MVDDNNEHGRDGGTPGAGASDSSPLRRVLIIEDEPPVANLLREALAARGCLVTVAVDGEAGRAALARETPDLVICDLLLPRVSGFRIIEELRTSHADLPVVVTSGVYRSSAWRHELSHARAFLEKPLGAAALEALFALVAATPAAGVAGLPPEPSRPAAATGPRQPWVPTAVLPLASALALAWSRRATGLLTHRCGELRTVFQVADGVLRFIRTNDHQLRLDRVLLQLGACEPDDLLRARDTMEQSTSPMRLGALLVDQGALTREELRQGLEAQLGCVVAAAFAAPGGETLFVAESALPREEISLDVDLRALIVAASAMAGDPDGTLLGHLPDGACPLDPGQAVSDETLVLPPTVRRLLRAVRPGTSVQDVLAMADLAGLAARSLVHGLLATKVLALAAGAQAWGRPEPVAKGLASLVESDALPPMVFLDLQERLVTGVLTVNVRGTSFRAFFERGLVTAASSDDARERLGMRLVAAGLVAADDITAALDAQRDGEPHPLGQILVDRGALRAEDLLRAVRTQATGVVREMLGHPRWDEANFVDGLLAQREPSGLGASASQLVLEFLRRCPTDHVDWLVGRLARLGAVACPEAELSRRFRLDDAERDVARSLPRDAARLVRLLGHAARSDAVLLRTLCLSLLAARTPVTKSA